MEHNQETPIEPINISLNEFGVFDQNNFVVLDDAKHVIGIDASDAGNLIIENVKNSKAKKFTVTKFDNNHIKNLYYHEDTNSLYCGDFNGQLYKYKVNFKSKTCEKYNYYGDLGIGWIISSHRFLQFVFFGGSEKKIKVLDLSTDQLLPGNLDTSIEYIYSLKVCVKSLKEIYLAVSGAGFDYSDDKTDLFEVSSLLPNDTVNLRKFFSSYSIDKIKTIFE